MQLKCLKQMKAQLDRLPFPDDVGPGGGEGGAIRHADVAGNSGT